MAIRQVTRAGVGLVVGIIILGLLVLGGLWLVRERGDQARREEAITIADQQLKAESDEDIALNTGEGTNEESTEQAPAEESPVITSPADNSAVASQPSSAAELPRTGPEAASIVAIGVLSFALLSFIRSRKLVSNQL